MKFNWKVSFIGLLIVNILIIGGLLIMVYSPGKTEEIVQSTQPSNSSIDLTLETNKQDLTTLINSYLQKEKLTKPISYKVLLTEKVMLIGKIPALGKEINLVLTFEPIVQENGDLVLEQESMTLGDLPLPVSYILKFINSNYSLPEMITIDAKERKVYAALTQMELKSDLAVKVESFNLHDDQIKFKIAVPTE